MKINWGTGIAIFIVIFFIAIFSFLYYTTTVDWDLVERDYYPRELRYQEVIDKKKNTESLKIKPVVNYKQGVISILFPADLNHNDIKGEVHIYRPSDQRLDKKYQIECDTNNRFYIDTETFSGGKYVLKLDWEANETLYYQEETIIK